MPLKATPVIATLLAACLLGGCEEAVPESVPSNALPGASPTARPKLLPALASAGDHARPVPHVPIDGAANGGICALDAINGTRVREARLRAEGSALFGGWAGNAARQVPAAPALVFKGDGSSHAVAFTAGASRPDVAKAHASEAMTTSGFNVPVRMDGFPPGRYALSVLVDPEAGTYCDLHAVIEVQP